MSDALTTIKKYIQASIQEIFGSFVDEKEFVLSETKKEFTGHYTLVVFPFSRIFKASPVEIGDKIGNWLKEHCSSSIKDYNVIKGFLNLEMCDGFWKDALSHIDSSESYGKDSEKNTKVLIEFSSPNTNKPLHLGHIRNILLGWSTARILEKAGYEVVKTQIVNDRGIAICKSMLAWQKFGNQATPQSKKLKGDFFVGEYYREFEKQFQSEYAAWQSSQTAMDLLKNHKDLSQDQAAFFKTFKNSYFNEYSSLGGEAKEMLLQWESKDPDTMALWKKMNSWVYEGFEVTYDNLGVHFDVLYYESDTYLLGKDIINKGLEGGQFYRKEDGSVWVDLEGVGLDHKILLRSDGTSVYMTQDLGTAHKRFFDHGATKMIYVVADEQDYHFKVLFEILKKLGEPYAEGLYHLSYGMVDLPSGRMKSREGTVVDADDLIDEVIEAVRQASAERGEIEDMTEENRRALYRKIGLAALKFFILRVNPQKRMIFNPEESVDIQGQTGPYIQNAYVRIQSILRKLGKDSERDGKDYKNLEETEVDLIRAMMNYPNEVVKAAEAYDPSIIAAFAYDLAKKFHKFYHEVRILKATEEGARAFRLKLAKNVAEILKDSLLLLGIEMPDRM